MLRHLFQGDTSNERKKRPSPSSQLYRNLFKIRKAPSTLEQISLGIKACIKNANRLLADANILAEKKRYPSARFLVTTAQEEIAKLYILIDMCRLDFKRHQTELHRLCRAFYNHIAKHAYLKLVGNHTYDTLAHVGEIWEVEVTQWWPAGSEYSEEPDMPHDTYFDRELPLYVDFGDFDQQWLVPKVSSYELWFEHKPWGNILDETRDYLERWGNALKIGVLSPPVLAVLNEGFKKKLVSESLTWRQMYTFYEGIAEAVHQQTTVSRSEFMRSPLVVWPLYHFDYRIKSNTKKDGN